MAVHYLTYPKHIKITDEGPFSLALGFFDGVHLGHQAVIKSAVDTAKTLGVKSAVMTFDPHPSLVLGKGKKKVFYITPLNQKIQFLQKLGVDDIFIVRFTSEFSQLSPVQFVDLFIKGLNVKHVTAGFDYSFGAFGKGNMDVMKMLGKDAFGVTVIEEQITGNEKISSTKIRQLLVEGEMEEIISLLGRPYQIDGFVVHGEKRGREIGFPTANVQPYGGAFIPTTGIYAVRLELQGDLYDGVCSVGYNPTFNNPDIRDLTIEVHLLDFERNIYGEEVSVLWYKRFRDEKKFDSIEALIEEMEQDKEKAAAYLQTID